MTTLSTFLRGFEYFVLSYFSILALSYALSGYLGIRSIAWATRTSPARALEDYVNRDFYKPISILIPSYNEESTIASNLRSMLRLHHPEFEIIVASDGPVDQSMRVMIQEFSLVEEPRVFRRAVETKPVRRLLRSLRHPNLLVIDKENGGRADAINAALNVATYPLVCVVDADSLLDADALVRASRAFLNDDTVIGVGGTLRPLNGAEVVDGRILELHAPRRWAERFQILEYARSFFVSRLAWSRFNSLLIISGAFGVFRRDAVLEVGGWRQGYVADDMEMVIKLHHHFRRDHRPYRLIATPDPICWTEVPSTFRGLFAQRNMWQRGTWEVLWRHRGMLGNPRYGRIGLFGLPYLWVFEAGAALVEVCGYLYVAASLVLGQLDMTFAVLFLMLAVLYGVLLSELAMGFETILVRGYEGLRDRLLLLLAAFVEYLGFRQVLAVGRAFAVLQVKARHGQYWTAPEPTPTRPTEAPLADCADVDRG